MVQSEAWNVVEVELSRGHGLVLVKVHALDLDVGVVELLATLKV